MKKIRTNTVKEIFALMIVVSELFLLLYHQMLFGDKVYLYSDIGTDTVNQYYPYYEYLQGDSLLSGRYSFQNGLGRFSFAKIFQFFNPAQLLYSLAGSGNMPGAVLCLAFVCIAVSATFAYLLFRHDCGGRFAALCGALIWAFSGYMILWGQHYSFAVQYAYFSVYMYFFVRCRFRSWKDMVAPTICIALFCYNYYGIYMVGLFSVAYLIIRGFLTGEKGRAVVRKLLMLAGSACVAVLLAMFYLLPNLETFLGSSRSGNLELNATGVFYSLIYLITDLARFFSSNALGIGNDYTGAYNYYEGAVLFTSGLCGFALVYSLLKKGIPLWKKLLFFAMVAASLICPFVTKLFTFDERKQRWTFLLLFCGVWGIVRMLNELFQERDVIHRKKIAWGGAVGYLVGLAILAMAHHYGVIVIEKRAMFWAVDFLVVYFLILLFCSEKRRCICQVFLLIAIVSEIIFCEYPVINREGLISKEEFFEVYYQDGTAEAADYLEEEDETLYRVVKTYISVFLDDALIQGYNGLTDYNAVMEASVANYMTDNDIPFYVDSYYSRASKYISVPWNNYFITTLLGTKYLISDGTAEIGENYIFLTEVRDREIYVNQYSLSFGYLYDACVEKDDYEQLGAEEKAYCMTQAFYYTDGSGETTASALDLTYEGALQGLQSLRDSEMENVTFTDNVLTGTIVSGYEQAMLCLPVFFDENWTAYVDGQETEICNINGGLIGVEVEGGEHTIELRYQNRYLMIGTKISLATLVGVVLFLVIMCRYHHVYGRKEPEL